MIMNMKLRNIPFSPPDMSEAEANEVREAILSGWITTGPRTKKLEKTISGKIPDCESYIVGHHGSKSSSSQALLNKALPELCIISVGEGNSYGHPSGETIDKLRRIGAEIKRTDLDGTITVYSRR